MSWAAVKDTSEGAALARELSIGPLSSPANIALLDAVHPYQWTDASTEDVYDLVAIGSGAGGLVSAKQSARRGARSAIISETLAGGDCLNFGCVPSKALLHCAKVYREAKNSHDWLVGAGNLTLDFGKVMERMRELRAKIAPADSHTATVGAGADVYQGRGRFVGPHELEVNGKRLRFRKAVIATGGRALIPDIEGLDTVPYLTNFSLFNLTELPKSLLVVGAGAVGLEMAQAFALFGSEVTVVCRSSVCGKESLRAGAAIQKALEADGVKFRTDTKMIHVEQYEGQIQVHYQVGSERRARQVEALLIATGRQPNVEDLGLETAGIKYSPTDGILINDLAATSNPDVYAIGDCAANGVEGGSPIPRFTHNSGEMAKLIVENALFRKTPEESWKVSSLIVPRCIYTEPEVAGVGLTRAEADTKGIKYDVYDCALASNDRCILEGTDDNGGFVELLCEAGTDTILGGTIVSAHAGEIINEVTLAVQKEVGLAELARVIHPYPTVAEGVMQAGLGFIRKSWAKMPEGGKRKRE